MILSRAFDPETEPSKFLKLLKQKTSKHFSWTRSKALQEAMFLAYWLHVFDEDEQSLEVCRFLAQFQFGGNYHLWASIEGTLALQSRLSRRQGLSGEATECVERIRSSGFLESRLSGVLLKSYERNVQNAVDSAVYSLQLEKGWRLLTLKELLIMIEMGGSHLLPVDMLELRAWKSVKRLGEIAGLPLPSASAFNEPSK